MRINLLLPEVIGKNAFNFAKIITRNLKNYSKFQWCLIKSITWQVSWSILRDDFIALKQSLDYLFVVNSKCTHPDSFDWLCRPHITQYRCGYWRYCDKKAEKLLRMQLLQSTLIVPSTVLRLVVATAVLCYIRPTYSWSGGIWMCMYMFASQSFGLCKMI